MNEKYKKIVNAANFENRFDIAAAELMDRFPYNLLATVTGTAEMVLNMYIPGLTTVLNSLSWREQELIYEKFVKGTTLSQMAEMFGVTKERIRQLEAATLRKLRLRDNIQMMLGVSRSSMITVQNELIREGVKNEELINTLSKIYKMPKEPAEDESDPILCKSIDELDFSTRTRNILARAGIKTLGELSRKSEKEISVLRNLGNHSMNEIKEKLGQYNLKLSDAS